MIDTLRMYGESGKTFETNGCASFSQVIENTQFIETLAKLDKLVRDTGIKNIAQGGYRNATVAQVKLSAAYNAKYCAQTICLLIPMWALKEYSIEF